MGLPMLNGDKDTHDGFGAGSSLVSSANVLINGKPVGTMGSAYLGVHSNSNSDHPAGQAVQASTSVFVNGKGVHLEGHRTSCGGRALKSSAINTTVGE